MTAYHRKTPMFKILLGNMDTDRGSMRVYNVNGEARFVKYNPNTKKYIVSDRWSGGGYYLRLLGIESNAGGQIFRHFSLPKNAFVGKTREEIIQLQQEAGR